MGFVLVIIGALCCEFSVSSGKRDVALHREGLYSYGFLGHLWILVFFVIIALAGGSFVFSAQSIPLLCLFVVLEAAQVYSSLNATVTAHRSTMGFLMVGTVPLLLVVDFLLGYELSVYAVSGVAVIVIGLLVLYINHGLNKKGIGYVLFSMFNAVATISVYKYMITHYNSVAAQQIVTTIVMLGFLYCMAQWKNEGNPLRLLQKRHFLLQSLSQGVGAALFSAAYVYAPASVITGAKRAAGVFWAVVSGNRVFHEKHLIIKMFSLGLVTAGLVLLMW